MKVALLTRFWLFFTLTWSLIMREFKKGFLQWMIIGIAFVFGFRSKYLNANFIKGSCRTDGILSVSTVLFHIEITSWINPLAISSGLWSSSAPWLCCSECGSVWIECMLVFHMSVHGWITEIGSLANLTLEVTSCSLSSWFGNLWFLPLILIAVLVRIDHHLCQYLVFLKCLGIIFIFAQKLFNLTFNLKILMSIKVHTNLNFYPII